MATMNQMLVMIDEKDGENTRLRAACGAIVQEIDDNQVYYGSLQGHREQLAAAIGGAVAGKRVIVLRDWLDALLQECDALRAELNAALDALREAPDPTPPVPVVLGYCYCVQGEYEVWYNGERAAALEQAASEVDFIQAKE